MNNKFNWKHKWFGVWKEMGAKYEACPSITDFIEKIAGEHPNKEQIVKYLETAHVVATTSKLRFPCVLTGKTFSGSLSYRTDGEWLWPDDLAYYFREHQVQLPEKMIETIQRNNFIPPSVSKEAISKLEWPPA